jgi:hypothetical protein
MSQNYPVRIDFFREFCNFLLPGSSSKGVPSFSDLGLIEVYFQKHDHSLLSSIQTVHSEIIQCAFGSKKLTTNELEESFNQLMIRSSGELAPILSDLLSLYYSNKTVIASMGLNKSLPFPKGIRLHEMDFELLIPVLAQGRKFKNAGGHDIEIK